MRPLVDGNFSYIVTKIVMQKHLNGTHYTQEISVETSHIQ